MSLANILKPTNKQHFTDAISEYDMTNIKCDTIGSRVGLAPLILEGVGLSGNGSAIVGAMAAVETDGLFSNDAQKVADLSGGVADFTQYPLVNGVPIGLWNGDATSDLSMNGFDIKDAGDVGISGDLDVSGNAIIDGDLTVKGTVIKKDELDVCGNAQFFGDVYIEDNLDVSGSVVIDGNITCNTLNYQTLNPPIEVDANIEYTDVLPTPNELIVDFKLYQDADKVARLLKRDPSDLFPNTRPPRVYDGGVVDVADESTLRDYLTGNVPLPPLSVLRLTEDLTITTPLEFNVNVQLTGDTLARKITSTDATVTINVNGRCSISNITIENRNTSSVATAINLVGLPDSVDIVDCNVLTNEFAIETRGDNNLIKGCNFASVGTPNNQRYINIKSIQRFIIIEGCNFGGSNTSSIQCVFMNQNGAEYNNAQILIYDCVGGNIPNPVQRLGICESDLTGTNLELWLKNNDFTTSSGYFIFFNANALVGIDTIGLLNNTETEVSSDSGKGLIGCDFVSAGVLGTPTLYALDNQPADLRSDYASYSDEVGLVAYKDSRYSPSNTLPTDFDNRFAVEGGGFAISDLQMNDKKITFTDRVAIVSQDQLFENQGVNSVAIGTSTAQRDQGIDATAVGVSSGAIFQGDFATAIGRTAGQSNQGVNATAVGRSAGFQFQGEEAVAIGRNAGLFNQGAQSIGIGLSAGENDQPANSIILNASGSVLDGTQSGLYVKPVREATLGKSLYYDETTGEIAYDDGAGGWVGTAESDLNMNTFKITYPNGKVRIGTDSGNTNQGNNAIAIGSNSGVVNQGSRAIAIGESAGFSAQHASSIILNASGSALNSSGPNRFFVKPIREATLGKSLYYDATSGEIAYDDSAGGGWVGTAESDLDMDTFKITYPDGKVRIGTGAGVTSQGIESVAIGINAGATQGIESVAIGKLSGNTQGAAAVAIGSRSGQFSQNNSAVAIGQNAGQSGQGSSAVAIGASSGLNNQGISATAVGQLAGNSGQAENATAVGSSSGNSNQGDRATAVGHRSGNSNQGTFSTAIGFQAGESDQGSSAVAIGNSSGADSQGSNAIAIGKDAGASNQHANSIILNASGIALNSNDTDRLFIKPIRGVAHGIGEGVLKYDPSTGEITYSTNNP